MKSINNMKERENNIQNNVSNPRYRLQKDNFAKRTEKKLKRIIRKIRRNKGNIIKFLGGTVIIGAIVVACVNYYYIPEINESVSTIIDYNSDHIYIDELKDNDSVKNYIQLCNCIDICDSISDLEINYNKIYEPLKQEDIEALNNYTLEDTMALITEYKETKSDDLAAKLYYLRNYNYNYVVENGSYDIEDFLLVFIKSTVAYSLNVSPNEISDMNIPSHHGQLGPDDSMIVRYNQEGYDLKGHVETMCYNLYDIQSHPLKDYETISRYTNRINYYMFFDTSYDEKGFLGFNENIVETDNSKKYYKEFKKDFQ